jgi:hypothetical protein
MLTLLRLALAVSSLLVTTPAAAAPPERPSCADATPAVIAAVAAACNCVEVERHGQYVRCAGRVLKAMAQDGSLARSCRGQMIRGFARSTCGKPEHVTCCLERRGIGVCTVKRPSVCERLGGVPGATATCIDACLVGSPSGAFVD